MNLDRSELRLIMGPMMSGKSTLLYTEINKLRIITDNILVISHSYDKQRHHDMNCTGSIGELITHDNKRTEAYMVNKLDDIWDDTNMRMAFNNADVVVIDESQFFCDLFDFVSSYLTHSTKHRIYIVAGLNGDYRMKPIGQIVDLISLADSVIMTKAYCQICKEKEGKIREANFTMLLNPNSSLIGGKETYIAVCRKHHKIPN